MTLILGVLTNQYVALISDRRVTTRVGTRIVSQEDTDVKAIALGGQFLMGFTGLARMDGRRIEAWASSVLRDVKPEDYFEVLRQKIEEAFVRDGQAGKMPHAFVAVGYASLQPGGPVYPLSVTVSNSFDSGGRFSTAVPVSPQFSISIERLGNRRQLIVPAGHPVHKTALRALEHRIRVVVRGEPSNPALTVGSLLMALRDTSRRSGGFVGTAAMFASMPRCALPNYSIAAGEVDYRKQVAAVFLPDEARNAGDAAIYVPALINQQIHVFGIKVFPRILSPEEIRARAVDEGYRY